MYWHGGYLILVPCSGSKLVMPGMQMEGEPLYELIEKEDVTLSFWGSNNMDGST